MAIPTANPKRLRIGVDVGGTNTDGVLLDPLAASAPDAPAGAGILAWHKSATTLDPSDGISTAIAALLLGEGGGGGGKEGKEGATTTTTAIDPAHVASVTVGTTHFVNAVVERDAGRLRRVAVLRLAGPFGRSAPPCADWPADMRELVLGYHASVRGGLEVDGRLIAAVDEAEVRRECAAVRERGIGGVVVVGVFSPIDTVERQEERVAAIVAEEIPGCDVVCSKDVANLGFLARENAAVLNASVLPFARRTIRSFQEPVRRLGLDCPVFITQNDGTILSGEMAARLPIRTFSSGPTNSMRGAAVLARGQLGKDVMVVDIGGTTTDVGLLLANGFPRQQAAYSELAGVRMNFPCPDVKSVGLGGGSIVRKRAGNRGIIVGPESVGFRLTEKALVFGGDVLTATDCAVATNTALEIGKRALVENALDPGEFDAFKSAVKRKIEKVIDTMKTSPEGIPVLLVGGGAVVAPDELEGASTVIRPEWSGVANAIGAATAGVSAVVDTVKSTESKTTSQLLDEVSKEAVGKAIAAGATPESVKIVEMETLPLQVCIVKS